MSIKRTDEFVEFLENYMLEEEAAELEITITGEAEEDAPLINSREKANYFLKLMTKIQEDIDCVNEACNLEIEKTKKRVEDFRESQLRTLTSQKEYYEKLLTNFTINEIANSKKKSVALPYGTLSIKKAPVKWEYNEEELLNWAKKNAPDLVATKVTEAVVKADLKASVDKEGQEVKLNGQVVSGVSLVEQPDKFNVKLK